MRNRFPAPLPILALALACVMATWSPGAIEPHLAEIARKQSRERQQVLLDHGVLPVESELVRLLEDGFVGFIPDGGLPTRPIAKVDVYYLAIAEAGFQRCETAVPVLVELVRGNVSEGLRQILGRDLEPIPIANTTQVHDDMMVLARFNAIIALGYIGGGQADVAAEAIHQAMREAPADGYITEGAVALGMLGDPRGIGPLVELAGDPASDSIPGVYRAVFELTGRNYGITAVSPISKRRDALRQLETWKVLEGPGFQPSRADIIRRRATGPRTAPLPANSLRGALRATRNLEDYDLRYAGRQYLFSAGPGIAPDLREIALDEDEDLDIRRAAMSWWASADPKAARRAFRQVARDDENEVIRRQAETLIADIERAQ